ncbi:uncharacterized protein [Macrobrachium rosenbergii]|uniref:uncharacterized protein n=1 Tax=Macrobrachium rosenbergii TaxID=79674 RepID=UPI0034D71105
MTTTTDTTTPFTERHHSGNTGHCQTQRSAASTENLEPMPENAGLPVPSQKTTKAATVPSQKITKATTSNSRFLHQRRNSRTAPAGRYGGNAVGLPAIQGRFRKNTRLDTRPHSSKRNSHPHVWHDDRTISILGRRYHWPFIIVDVKFPLLGADFLGHHGLLVDVARQRLLDTGTCHSRQLSTRPGMPTICSTAPNGYTSLLQKFPDVFKPELCHGLLVDIARQRLLDTGTFHSRQLSTRPGYSNCYTSLLQEFPDVFKPELRQSPGPSAKHSIFHHITTMGPPTHAKF